MNYRSLKILKSANLHKRAFYNTISLKNMICLKCKQNIFSPIKCYFCNQIFCNCCIFKTPISKGKCPNCYQAIVQNPMITINWSIWQTFRKEREQM